VQANQILEYGRSLAESLGKDATLLEGFRHLLINGYVPTMSALMTLTVLFALLAARPLWGAVRRISANGWIGALLIANLALLLRTLVTPHLPQVYFDEIFFLNTAENMARSGENALSMVGGYQTFNGFHPCPAAWQYLISLAYRAFGHGPDVAFALATALSGLSTVLLFVAVHAMFGSERAGLLAALFLAVLPVHMRLAGSAALETASLFFLLAGLAVIAVWFRDGGDALVPLACAFLAVFINVRMENVFALLPLVLAFFALVCPSERMRGWRVRLAWTLGSLVLAVFSLPPLMADYYGLATHFYFFYESSEDIRRHVSTNFSGNFLYWIEGAIHPLPLTVLALLGLVVAARSSRWRRVGLFWAGWWLALVLFYSANPSCDFSLRFTLDSWRTALHPALGVIILAALGADALCRQRTVLLGMVALALAVVPVYNGFVQSRHMWMAQWELHREARALLPESAWLLVYDNMGTLGARSLAMSRQIAWNTGLEPHFFIVPEGQPDPQIVRDVAVENRPVFLYYLHTGGAEAGRSFERLQNLLRLSPLVERRVESTRVHFALYRVQPLSPLALEAP